MHRPLLKHVPGSIILNLINNAFYAVDEKKKQIGDGYEPEATVTKLFTAPENPSIRQSANRPIPSANYDIIKAHCGSLTVNSITRVN